MEFPRLNKLPQGSPSESLKGGFLENAALLQELLQSIVWSKFFYWYCILFGTLLVSVFLMIAVVRLALLIP